jgi:hypothetical protein
MTFTEELLMLGAIFRCLLTTIVLVGAIGPWSGPGHWSGAALRVRGCAAGGPNTP